jgi:hypothetical protein
MHGPTAAGDEKSADLFYERGVINIPVSYQP